MSEIKGRLFCSDFGSSSYILGNLLTQIGDIDAKLQCLKQRDTGVTRKWNNDI